jgi:hypothetical protein
MIESANLHRAIESRLYVSERRSLVIPFGTHPTQLQRRRFRNGPRDTGLSIRLWDFDEQQADIHANDQLSLPNRCHGL